MNTEDLLEHRRQEARRKCAEHGVAIVPYGNGVWIRGDGIDVVLADLANLQNQDLRPVRETFER